MGSGTTNLESEKPNGNLEQWIKGLLYDWVSEASTQVDGGLRGRGVDGLEQWMRDMYTWALDVSRNTPGLSTEPPAPPGWTGAERIGVRPPPRPR